MAQQPNPSSASDEVSAASLIKWVLSMFTLTFLVILLVRSDWFNALLQQRHNIPAFIMGGMVRTGQRCVHWITHPRPATSIPAGQFYCPPLTDPKAPSYQGLHHAYYAVVNTASSIYTEDLEPYLPIAGITAVLLMATGLAYAQQKRSPHRPSHPQNSPAPSQKKKHTSAGNAPSSIHIVPPSTPSGQSNTFYQQNVIYNFYFYNVNYNAPPEGNPNSPKPDEK
jgi:hypothetical protein